MTAPGPEDPEAIRNTLRARLETLKASIESTADDRKPVELDQSMVGRLSRMDAMQQRQMALASERQRRTDIARTEAALRRLDAGEYGFCVNCGERISAARLAADPAIPSCLACARRG